MQKLNIAGIPFEYIADGLNDCEKLEPFQSKVRQDTAVEINIIPVEKLNPPPNITFRNNYFEWLHEDNNLISLYIINGENNEIAGLLQTDNTWKKVLIKYLVDIITVNDIITGRLGEIIFLNSLLFHQGLLIHASAILWQEKGIIFTAPSGTGKSTQAKLWKEIMGAKVLNGDRSAVRLIEDKPYIYGSPWCGSSNQYLNQNALLSAIVILTQSSENALQRLDWKEALPLLLPRCFLPYYDDGEIMRLAFVNLEKIIVTVPIYLLSCRPDRGAVELVYECIK